MKHNRNTNIETNEPNEKRRIKIATATVRKLDINKAALNELQRK